MASFRDIYRTPLLSAKALGKKTLKGTIEQCYPETVGQGKDKAQNRLIIEINDGSVRISLNKTNATRLADAFGEDYNDWPGNKIIVKTAPTQFKGEAVDGLMVSPSK